MGRETQTRTVLGVIGILLLIGVALMVWMLCTWSDILPGMNSEVSKPTEHGNCAINRTSHKCGLTAPTAKVDAPTL